MKKLLLAATLGFGLGMAPTAFAGVDLFNGAYDFDAKIFSTTHFTDTFDFNAGPDGGRLAFSLAELKLEDHVDIDWDDTAAFSVIADDGTVLYRVGESVPIQYVLEDALDVPTSFSIVLKGAAIGEGTGLWSPGLKGSYSLSVLASPVPEPESYALMLAGLGIVGYSLSRRRRSD
ncbi:FxDxF family PEP-CTERM protein [Aquabacterium sp. A7-Y]|uniref:FxDxF family PEP-CTERM protein n=1 Tax=Aquabacterium sp. A7-Y TaxID=1349605 RepID=UPI00223CBA7B|nr:FxDxF family PEP-CTERM protein [Aquabacterium sp. A7-Y]MCW7539306.1 FxDxF family PEP-CTERM protein [Aquabacterium sp. A7-Y]